MPSYFPLSVSQIRASLISGWWFGFRLEPILNTALAASKILLDLKVVKIDPKIIIPSH